METQPGDHDSAAARRAASAAKLVIIPSDPPITIESLVAQITDENRHDEIDPGARAGNEVW
ncbi:MAG TPA: hypothetical protein VNI54_07355 [Thermoanaerobaculia bacterium]|nr:hypothetical protein [Thermoanaerobaculia bacterium]